jgi:hypothetical protein
MKTQIQYINKKTKFGFIGMNDSASKTHNIKWNHKKHPEHTIEIYKNVPKDVRVATIAHEKMEKYLMNTQHQRYKRAHKNALRFEELDIPFPSTNIKQKLKQVNFDII